MSADLRTPRPPPLSFPGASHSPFVFLTRCSSYPRRSSPLCSRFRFPFALSSSVHSPSPLALAPCLRPLRSPSPLALSLCPRRLVSRIWSLGNDRSLECSPCRSTGPADGGGAARVEDVFLEIRRYQKRAGRIASVRERHRTRETRAGLSRGSVPSRTFWGGLWGACDAPRVCTEDDR